MNRIVLLSLTLAVLAASAPAFAQVFYQYPAAPIVEKNELRLGPLLAYGEGDLFRLAGFGRFNAGGYVDLGVELLADVRDGNWRGGVGVDIKLSLFPTNRALPFDMSVDAGFGFIAGDGRPTIQLPAGAILSSPFQMNNGQVLTPYVGVYVVTMRVDKGGETEMEVDVELRGGLSYTVTESAQVFATAHLGLEKMISVGVDLGRPFPGSKNSP